MDRFAPPAPEIVKAYCGHCGREIYAGEEVYDVCNYFIHEDCLRKFAGPLKTIEEALGE